MRHASMTRSLPVTAVAFALVGLWAQEIKPGAQSKADPGLPPRVIKTEPANLAEDVDFSTREIRATFDRKMQTENSWSWMIHRNIGAYPGYKPAPEIRWEDDGKTCVLPVRLSPDTLYAVGLNSYRHTGFKDVAGKVAIPYVLVFRTKKAQ